MAEATGETGSRTARARWAGYLLGFAVIQAGVLLGLAVVGASSWFLTHDDYPGLRAVGYSMRAKHKDCEVLIYGDSAAMTGVDPQVVGKIAGMTACNISEGGTVQNVVGSDLPLDTYLANNNRPRYLLLMYTPSLFRPRTPAFKAYEPEGMAFALHYVRGPKLWGALLLRPVWVGRFGIWVGHAVLTNFLARHHFPGLKPAPALDTMAMRDARDGVFPYPLPSETHCVRSAVNLPPGSIKSYPGSADAMRRKYGVGGTRVLIDVAPVPDCDTLVEVYRARTAGQRDNQLETLPISDFNEGDVHFSEAGVLRVSTEAGEQILALESGVAKP